MSNWPDANPEDVSSVEAVIKAFDDVLTFAPNEYAYDDKRFLSLFLPTASITSPEPWNLTINPAQWADFFKGAMKEMGLFDKGFGESNIIKKVLTIGNVSSVYTYYTLHSPATSTESFGCGVNMFHIVNLDGRFAIASLIWEDESETAPTPMFLMPHQVRTD